MSKAEHETSPRGSLVCPSCKQPLSTIVKKRHKTLGVYVPVWGPGPCHNAECAGHVQESERDRLQEH